jgi:glycosyltransferase involved in cell wall biosynthesis
VIADVKNLNTEIQDPSQDVFVEALAMTYQSCLRVVSRTAAPNTARIRVEGHFEGTYSLAILNNQFFDSLSARNSLTSKSFLHFNSVTDEFIASTDTSAVQTSQVFTRNTYPPIAEDMKGEINTFHSYNWEESIFPEEFVAQFNNFLDGVTCASSFVQKVLIDSGVNIPTAVTGLGSNLETNIVELENPRTSTFEILHVSSAFPRKGIDILLEAYFSSFTSQDDVCLTLKTFPNPHNDIEVLLEQYSKRQNLGKILLINRDITKQELSELYSKADLVVQPSRGEGFGLPILESLQRNIPTIATGWGGQTDFFVGPNAVSLNYSLQPARSHVASTGSLWAEPDLDHLKKLMRIQFEKGKQRKVEHHIPGSWQENTGKYLDFINSISGRSLVTPKIAWISTWNTKCGIAEYSKDLLISINDLNFKIIAPKTGEPISAELESKCIRTWTPGDGEIRETLKVIQSEGFNCVVIQHNWGFFNDQQLIELLENSKDLIIVLEFHSLRDDKGNIWENYFKIKESLKYLDRILVHDLWDLNMLASDGFADRVVYFPHPIPDYGYGVDHRIEEKSPIKIGTSGFALPHKGHIELIHAIGLLRERGLSIDLTFQTPEHPDPSSRLHIEHLKKYVSQNKYSNINFDTNFYPETVLISKLAEFDLLVYPYQKTGESASGAARHGLASGRPVIITPSSIFESIRPYTFPTKGFTALEIADGIADTIKSCTDSSQLMGREEALQSMLNNLSFTKASVRLKNMLQGLLNQIDINP